MDNTGLLPLTVEDFSGGITDFYLGGATNKAQAYDNFILNENNDLITRPGCTSKFDVRVSASGTIKNIIDNQDNILMQANRSIVYVDNNGSHEIKSPNGHDIFVGASDSVKASFAYWNRHTLGTSNNFNSPQKAYKNENDEWTLTTLGVPEILYATAIGLANELKAKYEAHRVDDSAHTNADVVNAIVSPNASNLDSLFDLTEELLQKINLHMQDANGTNAYHINSFDREATADEITSVKTAYDCLSSILEAYNLHDDGDNVHNVEGSHQASVSKLGPETSFSAGAISRIVGLQYSHRYSVEDLEFLERGPIHLIEVEDAATGSITVSKIPQLQSGALENWDDSNIKIQVYKTVADGTTLFFEKEISNGTTSTTLDLDDDALQLNPTAYTEGGVLNDERPVPCKFVATANDTTFFGAVKENRVMRNNRLRCTKPASPYSSPGSFFIDFEDDITGLGVKDIYPIAFLKSKFYRVEGSFDSQGRGGLVKRSISQRIGCISYRSIVVTKDGVYFAAADGFYFTDGFSYRKISHDINLSFARLTSVDDICGTYDSLRNRVLWSVKKNGNNENNDTIYVAFLDYKTEYGGHPIYTWSGGLDPDNFTATALGFIANELLRADERGYLLKHSDELFSDVYIDTSLSPDEWYTQTIFYDYRSVAFDFGNAQVRKWVPKVNINADNQSSLSLQIAAANDNSGVFSDLKPINKQLNVEWGDPNIFWNESDIRWNYNPVISEWRWMPASAPLRCMYKQLRFANAYTEIDNSVATGAASGVSATRKILLLSYPEYEWINDPVNYFISFEAEDYENEYKILGVDNGELTVEDDGNTLTDFASSDWKINGYKKREIFNLLNYVIGYRVISMTQETVRASETTDGD